MRREEEGRKEKKEEELVWKRSMGFGGENKGGQQEGGRRGAKGEMKETWNGF